MNVTTRARAPRLRTVRSATRTRKAVRVAVRYALLTVILIFAVFPLLWNLAIAVTDKTALTGTGIYDFPGSLFPRHLTLNNFVQVFQQFSLGKYLLNSVIISGLTVIGTVIVSVMAAYPFARFNFPLKNILFGLIIATLVLPTETSFIVNVLTLNKMHLVGTYAGVVLPTVAGAFGIFLMRQAFLTIPESLLEAGRLDGATELQTLWHIMVPLARPSIATLAVFTLVTSWNSYFWPYIILSGNPDLAPLSVAVLKLKGQFNYDPFNIAAGNLFMMLPILAIFLFAQRYFMRALEGAVK